MPFTKVDAETIAAHLPRDVEAFRDALAERRSDINLTLWARAVTARTAWMAPVENAINWGALVFVLLLFGPILVYRRAPPEARSVGAAWRSFPYFVVAVAGCMLSVNGLASAVIDIQALQITAASFGSMEVSLTDATIQYVIDEAAPTRVLIDDLLAPGLRADPAAVMTFYTSAWKSLAALQESALLEVASNVVGGLSWLVDLYGPVLALLVLVVLGQVGVPLVARLLRYPRRVVEGATTETPGTFLWDQAKRIFAEVRIAVWLLLVILLLTALAVVIVRIAAFPVAWMSLEALASATLDLRAGGTVPEVALLLSAASLAVYMATTALGCLLPVAVALSKTQFMLRARYDEKKRFRDFPVFWRTVGALLGKVLLPTVAAAALTYGAVYGVSQGVDVGAHSWLPALAAPLLLFALWRLRVVATLRELLARPVH